MVASVPAAPPNSSTSSLERSRVNRTSCLSNVDNSRAILKPNVIGTDW
jgi:hypothetical protein